MFKGRGAWQGGMHGEGHAWQGHVWQGGMRGRGACMAGGCVAGETATAADWNAFLLQ